MRRIADHKYFGMTRYGQVGIDDDPPGLVRGRAQPASRRRGQHSSAPQYRARKDPLAAGNDTLRIHEGDASVRVDFDTQPLQVTLRLGRKRFRIRGQHARFGLE